MYQGDYLFLDTIQIQRHGTEEVIDKNKAHLSTCIDKVYMAYGFNWPYFSYASQQDQKRPIFIFILNAFNPNFIQRYQLPSQVVRCMKTILTDTHDLYAICEIKNGMYEVYNIDLDKDDPVLEGNILRYSKE